MGIPGSASPLLLVQAAGAAPAGYEIERSLRFNSGDSSALTKRFEATGNTKTWTFACWVKQCEFGNALENALFSVSTVSPTASGTDPRAIVRFSETDNFQIGFNDGSTGWKYCTSSAKYRDPSAWYHVVVAIDSTQATAADRTKAWINGEEVSWGSATYISQNASTVFNTASIVHAIGRYEADSTNNNYVLDGYLADVHFIDGLALPATAFGEYDANNVWQPKEIDSAPNDGTVWSNSYTASDSFQGAAPATNGFDGSLSTRSACSTSGCTVTFTPSSPITVNSSLKIYSGYGSASVNGGSAVSFSGSAVGWQDLSFTGTLTSLAVTGNSSGTPNAGEIYAVQVDGVLLIDNFNKFTNGTVGINSFHLPFSDNTSTIALGTDTSVTVSAAEANKGMDVVTYTGNGGTQTINSLRFAPDFVWIKRRNSTQDHRVFDVIRGAEVGLTPNYTNGDYTATGELTAFNSDGFSLGTQQGVNSSGNTYVAWCWKAGGPAVTNTNGSITSQVSANQDYGFSIVTYTGNGTNPSTVGHGLNSAPKFIIHKCRSTAVNWFVYHESAGTGALEGLNTTAAYSSASTAFGSTAPTSSVITTGGDTNTSGRTYVDYCWSEVSGFSKFGSYSGGTNPQTITTGFKPRFLLIKRTDSSASHYVWLMIDSNRGGVKKLAANGSYAENDISYIGDDTQNVVEFLDTGFKLTTTNAASNASGGTYVYAAFASEPGNNWALNNFVANQTSTGFKAVTYTGNLSTQTISGVGFSPSLVWFKNRDAVKNHALVDVVRGGDKVLQSSTTGAEGTASNFITSFTSDGFTIGNDSAINGSGNGIVAWCWDAGSSTVSNTDGTITSSVRANTDLGFSIVTYTGNGSTSSTIGHGLGATPDFIITKARDTASQVNSWRCYHQAVGATKYLELNSSGGPGTFTDWANTAPTNSVFYVGGTNTTFPANENNIDYVAYCFAPKPGVSAFGSYTGNGNTSGNGPVVTLGFKPAFLMVKNVSATSDWRIFDSARNPTSPFTKRLYANLSAAESTNSTQEVTFTDNGFQVEASGSVSTYNVSGHTIIYIAFAAPPDGAEIDSLLDSPTEANVDSDTGAGGEVSGNYATLNPIEGGTQYGAYTPTLTNGNLDIASSSGWKNGPSTFAVSSGKWYSEVTVGSTSAHYIGICGPDFNLNDGTHVGNGPNTVAYYSTGQKNVNASLSSYGASYTTGDVIGTALDLDAGQITFYKNGTSQGVAQTGLSGEYFFVVSINGGSTASNVNFGQRAFAHPVSGFQPWTTALFDDPTIADGSTAMDVALYTGNGGTQSITGLGFSPDFVWLKNRTNTVGHNLYDIIRGVNKPLITNSTAAEDSTNIYGAVSAFNSDGFTVQNGSTDATRANASSVPYVAWTWDGGSSTVSNTDGSITSSVRANASAGFSIVSYTGTNSDATVGHGLGVTPSLIIVKCRTTATYSTTDWYVFTQPTGKDAFLVLNKTLSTQSNSGFWGTPNSSTFGVKNASGNNISSSDDHIAYCWAPVEGYSAFGSYTGNGASGWPNADGPFIYLGFRPKFVMWKCTSQAENWHILDVERSPYNFMNEKLLPNSSAAETENNNHEVDFLSNGFKLRNNNGELNQSGATYVYAAWASNPFKTSRAR